MKRGLFAIGIRALVAAAFVALAAIASVSCAGKESAGASASKPVIKMALNNWLGAELDDAVAQILLTEQLHYTDVELIDAGTSDQFGSVASGALHVSLEVWPSGHPGEIAQYIASAQSVENVGPLGPVGQVGWFLPTYLLTLHPELATWDGLKDADDVALFATAATTPKGQFVGGDPSWVQWDPQLIANLGLDFTEVWAGSENGILADLDQAYQARDPILFYFYQPHWAFAKYDLTQVQLPPYAAACWATQDCSYPADDLFKMVWPGLKAYAPDAYAFFKAFQYTTEDQTQMMNAVEDGQTVEQAARWWIDTHKSVWEAWIPAGE